jgi:hypothetical protein
MPKLAVVQTAPSYLHRDLTIHAAVTAIAAAADTGAALMKETTILAAACESRTCAPLVLA